MFNQITVRLNDHCYHCAVCFWDRAHREECAGGSWTWTAWIRLLNWKTYCFLRLYTFHRHLKSKRKMILSHFHHHFLFCLVVKGLFKDVWSTTSAQFFHLLDFRTATAKCQKNNLQDRVFMTNRQVGVRKPQSPCAKKKELRKLPESEKSKWVRPVGVWLSSTERQTAAFTTSWRGVLAASSLRGNAPRGPHFIQDFYQTPGPAATFSPSPRRGLPALLMITVTWRKASASQSRIRPLPVNLVTMWIVRTKSSGTY